MQALRCSIVVTCYNQREFIREAVDSALLQGADEVIVVDDTSEDGSEEILRTYGDIKLCRMPSNGGVARARNHGASLATGDYLIFVDGDDVLMPWALEVYKRVIESRNPILILGQPLWFTGPMPATKLSEAGRDRLKFVEYAVLISKDRSADLIASALVVQRAAFLAVGGWTPDIFHGDIKDLMMKLGDTGPLVLILEPMVAFYRVHDRNSIHQIASFMNSAHRLIGEERAGKYPGGSRRAFHRYAALGSYVAFWSAKGFLAGFWRDALKLAVAGMPMILAGAVQRCGSRLKGGRRVDVIDINAVHFRRDTNRGSVLTEETHGNR